MSGSTKVINNLYGGLKSDVHQDSYYFEDDIIEYLGRYKIEAPAKRVKTCFIDHDCMGFGQKRVLEIFKSQLCELNTEIKRVLVQGDAGTGKSSIIKAMCQTLDVIQQSQNSDEGKIYAALGPTGVAASNIGGTTIHNYLSLKAKTEMHPLSDQELKFFRLKFKNIKFIFIDEYSMIGLNMLRKIHERLCEASGKREPFGGYYVYFFGNIRQLPPVSDIAIYFKQIDQEYNASFISLVDTIQEKVYLEDNYRQYSQEIRFKQTLTNIACGRPTMSDAKLLTKRFGGTLPAGEWDKFSNAVRLFPTNSQKDDFNEQKLPPDHIIIDAIYSDPIARQNHDYIAKGLERRLKIASGSRVMLRRNICPERGLASGAFGTVRDIYRSRQGPSSLPFAILIEFDNFQGPFFKGRLFPLLPVTQRDHDYTVTQFPIVLAHALTIHMSQGLTLDRAVVDVGRKEMSAGLTYVALSRVRRLEDLIIVNDIQFSQLDHIAQMEHVIAREKFLSTGQRSPRRIQRIPYN